MKFRGRTNNTPWFKFAIVTYLNDTKQPQNKYGDVQSIAVYLSQAYPDHQPKEIYANAEQYLTEWLQYSEKQ